MDAPASIALDYESTSFPERGPDDADRMKGERLGRWCSRLRAIGGRESMNGKRRAEELRSHRWYGVRDLRSFGHRSRTKQMGYAAEDYSGKPVVGIINTWSDINPCHSHFKAEGRGGQAGCLAGGWVSGRDASDVSLRAVPETLDDALQELPRHGDRGTLALLSQWTARC